MSEAIGALAAKNKGEDMTRFSGRGPEIEVDQEFEKKRFRFNRLRDDGHTQDCATLMATKSKECTCEIDTPTGP